MRRSAAIRPCKQDAKRPVSAVSTQAAIPLLIATRDRFHAAGAVGSFGEP